MSHHSVMSYRTLHIFFFSSLCEPGFLQLPPSARSLSVRVNVDSFFLHSYDRFNQKIGPCESSIWHPTILCGIRKAVQRTANLIKAARNNFLDLTCHCVMFKWLHSKKKWQDNMVPVTGAQFLQKDADSIYGVHYLSYKTWHLWNWRINQFLS